MRSTPEGLDVEEAQKQGVFVQVESIGDIQTKHALRPSSLLSWSHSKTMWHLSSCNNMLKRQLLTTRLSFYQKKNMSCWSVFLLLGCCVVKEELFYGSLLCFSFLILCSVRQSLCFVMQLYVFNFIFVLFISC